MEGSAPKLIPSAPSDVPPGHEARLVHRSDGRWEVLCTECLRSRDQATPIGIGVPIVNRVEAEGIVRNHARRGSS